MVGRRVGSRAERAPPLQLRSCIVGEDGVDFGAVGGEGADGIGGGGVGGEEQRLAAAAAEVDRRGGRRFCRDLASRTSPRNFWKASFERQISARLWSFTFSNCRPGMILAAWQGSASPLGVISISLRPQPPMQGFGYFA